MAASGLLMALCVYVYSMSAAASLTAPGGKRISSFAGPFRTVVERFERCSAGRSGGGVSLHVERVSRVSHNRPAQRQRITGNLTLGERLDDSMTTMLTIDQWSNNQWKRNAFVMRLAELCSILKGTGILGGASCPVGQGVYAFSDMETDWSIPVIPEFYYGKWRAEAVFGKAGPGLPDAPVGCVRFFFQTSPAADANEL